ncbi:MAG: septum formation initiator family protein [Myxococcota bacterium]|nr:septum formation initiator family protein [Myxococcota bacterium]
MVLWVRIKRTVRTVVVASAVIGTFYAVGLYALNPEGRQQQKKLHAELERLHGANISLAERNERLRLQIAAIRYDDRYLEHVAREDLGLVHQGEVIYRFIEVRPSRRPKSLSASN